MKTNAIESTPVLSVIIPCYNVEKSIERALNSVSMQEVDFLYEIIVVDDGSTDRTREIISRYAETNPNIGSVLKFRTAW